MSEELKTNIGEIKHKAVAFNQKWNETLDEMESIA